MKSSAQKGVKNLNLNQTFQNELNEVSYSDRIIDSPTGEILSKEQQILKTKYYETVASWRKLLWRQAVKDIKDIESQTQQFSQDCIKIPMAFREGGPYKELIQDIKDLVKVLQIVKELTKPSIRDRHWAQINNVMQAKLPYDSDKFSLSHLLDAPLLNFNEEIGDIVFSAEKQDKLEKRLNKEIIEFWSTTEIQIKPWKFVNTPCIIGGNIGHIRQKLDEHKVILSQMNSMKHVKPFKATVEQWISTLDHVTDVIEQLLKSQTIWIEVFKYNKLTNFADSMPEENKIFQNYNNQWLSIMKKANQIKNFIKCCQDQSISNQI